MADATPNPFGHSISSDDILETLGFFDSWDDRYKYIIDLGKELPVQPESFHSQDRLLRGCQIAPIQTAHEQTRPGTLERA